MIDKVDGIKLSIVTIVGTVGSFLLTPILPNQNLFTMMCVIILFDFIMGIYVASKGISPNSVDGKIKSQTLLDGIFKKFFFVAFAVGAYYVDIGMEVTYVQSALIIGITLGEMISLVESMEILGWKVPQVLLKLISIWETKENGEQQ